MKRILVIVLVFVMFLGFAGCNASDDPAKDDVTDIRDYIPGIEKTELKLTGFETGSGGGTWGEPVWIPVADEENAQMMELLLQADMADFEAVDRAELAGTSWRGQISFYVFTDTTQYWVRMVDFDEENKQMMTITSYDLAIEDFLERTLDAMQREDNQFFLICEGRPFDFESLYDIYQVVLHDKDDPEYCGKVTDLATGKSFDMQKYWIYPVIYVFEGCYKTAPLDTAPDAEYELKAEINGITYHFDIDEGYFERIAGNEKGYGNVGSYKNTIWMYCLAENPNNVENDWP